jgi:hypothetical protein
VTDFLALAAIPLAIISVAINPPP